MRPYLRVANVFEDRIDATDLKFMDFSGVFDRYKLQVGDVLLNEGQTPELLGRPAIYRGQPRNVAFTNTLVRFRAGSLVLAEWALLVFGITCTQGASLRNRELRPTSLTFRCPTPTRRIPCPAYARAAADR